MGALEPSSRSRGRSPAPVVRQSPSALPPTAISSYLAPVASSRSAAVSSAAAASCSTCASPADAAASSASSAASISSSAAPSDPPASSVPATASTAASLSVTMSSSSPAAVSSPVRVVSLPTTSVTGACSVVFPAASSSASAANSAAAAGCRILRRRLPHYTPLLGQVLLDCCGFSVAPTLSSAERQQLPSYRGERKPGQGTAEVTDCRGDRGGVAALSAGRAPAVGCSSARMLHANHNAAAAAAAETGIAEDTGEKCGTRDRSEAKEVLGVGTVEDAAGGSVLTAADSTEKRRTFILEAVGPWTLPEEALLVEPETGASGVGTAQDHDQKESKSSSSSSNTSNSTPPERYLFGNSPVTDEEQEAIDKVLLEVQNMGGYKALGSECRAAAVAASARAAAAAAAVAFTTAGVYKPSAAIAVKTSETPRTSASGMGAEATNSKAKGAPAGAVAATGAEAAAGDVAAGGATGGAFGETRSLGSFVVDVAVVQERVEDGQEEEEHFEWVEQQVLRFLYCTAFDIPKTIQLLKSSLAFRSSRLPVSLGDVLKEIRDEGVAYWHGRDRALRPLLVIRVESMQQLQQRKGGKDAEDDPVTRVLVFSLEFFLRYLCVAGRVESWCILCDCRGTSLSSFPVPLLFRLLSMLQACYRGRLHRFYLLNAPRLFHVLARSLLSSVPASSAKKVRVFSSSEEWKAERSRCFARHQLEKKYGGDQPDIVKDWFPYRFFPGPFEPETKPEEIRWNSPAYLHREVSPLVHVGYSLHTSAAACHSTKSSRGQSSKAGEEATALQRSATVLPRSSQQQRQSSQAVENERSVLKDTGNGNLATDDMQLPDGRFALWLPAVDVLSFPRCTTEWLNTRFASYGEETVGGEAPAADAREMLSRVSAAAIRDVVPSNLCVQEQTTGEQQTDLTNASRRRRKKGESDVAVAAAEDSTAGHSAVFWFFSPPATDRMECETSRNTSTEEHTTATVAAVYEEEKGKYQPSRFQVEATTSLQQLREKWKREMELTRSCLSEENSNILVSRTGGSSDAALHTTSALPVAASGSLAAPAAAAQPAAITESAALVGATPVAESTTITAAAAVARPAAATAPAAVTEAAAVDIPMEGGVAFAFSRVEAEAARVVSVGEVKLESEAVAVEMEEEGAAEVAEEGGAAVAAAAAGAARGLAAADDDTGYSEADSCSLGSAEGVRGETRTSAGSYFELRDMENAEGRNEFVCSAVCLYYSSSSSGGLTSAAAQQRQEEKQQQERQQQKEQQQRGKQQQEGEMYREERQMKFVRVGREAAVEAVDVEEVCCAMQKQQQSCAGAGTAMEEPIEAVAADAEGGSGGVATSHAFTDSAEHFELLRAAAARAGGGEEAGEARKTTEAAELHSNACRGTSAAAAAAAASAQEADAVQSRDSEKTRELTDVKERERQLPFQLFELRHVELASNDSSSLELERDTSTLNKQQKPVYGSTRSCAAAAAAEKQMPVEGAAVVSVNSNEAETRRRQSSSSAPGTQQGFSSILRLSSGNSKHSSARRSSAEERSRSGKRISRLLLLRPSDQEAAAAAITGTRAPATGVVEAAAVSEAVSRDIPADRAAPATSREENSCSAPVEVTQADAGTATLFVSPCYSREENGVMRGRRWRHVLSRSAAAETTDKTAAEKKSKEVATCAAPSLPSASLGATKQTFLPLANAFVLPEAECSLPTPIVAVSAAPLSRDPPRIDLAAAAASPEVVSCGVAADSIRGSGDAALLLPSSRSPLRRAHAHWRNSPSYFRRPRASVFPSSKTLHASSSEAEGNAVVAVKEQVLSGKAAVVGEDRFEEKIVVIDTEEVVDRGEVDAGKVEKEEENEWRASVGVAAAGEGGAGKRSLAEGEVREGREKGGFVCVSREEGQRSKGERLSSDPFTDHRLLQETSEVIKIKSNRGVRWRARRSVARGAANKSTLRVSNESAEFVRAAEKIQGKTAADSAHGAAAEREESFFSVAVEQSIFQREVNCFLEGHQQLDQGVAATPPPPQRTESSSKGDTSSVNRSRENSSSRTAEAGDRSSSAESSSRVRSASLASGALLQQEVEWKVEEATEDPLEFCSTATGGAGSSSVRGNISLHGTATSGIAAAPLDSAVDSQVALSCSAVAPGRQLTGIYCEQQQQSGAISDREVSFAKENGRRSWNSQTMSAAATCTGNSSSSSSFNCSRLAVRHLSPGESLAINRAATGCSRHESEEVQAAPIGFQQQQAILRLQQGSKHGILNSLDPLLNSLDVTPSQAPATLLAAASTHCLAVSDVLSGTRVGVVSSLSSISPGLLPSDLSSPSATVASAAEAGRAAAAAVRSNSSVSVAGLQHHRAIYMKKEKRASVCIGGEGRFLRGPAATECSKSSFAVSLRAAPALPPSGAAAEPSVEPDSCWVWPRRASDSLSSERKSASRVLPRRRQAEGRRRSEEAAFSSGRRIHATIFFRRHRHRRMSCTSALPSTAIPHSTAAAAGGGAIAAAVGDGGAGVACVSATSVSAACLPASGSAQTAGGPAAAVAAEVVGGGGGRDRDGAVTFSLSAASSTSRTPFKRRVVRRAVRRAFEFCIDRAPTTESNSSLLSTTHDRAREGSRGANEPTALPPACGAPLGAMLTAAGTGKSSHFALSAGTVASAAAAGAPGSAVSEAVSSSAAHDAVPAERSGSYVKENISSVSFSVIGRDMPCWNRNEQRGENTAAAALVNRATKRRTHVFQGDAAAATCSDSTSPVAFPGGASGDAENVTACTEESCRERRALIATTETDSFFCGVTKQGKEDFIAVPPPGDADVVALFAGTTAIPVAPPAATAAAGVDASHAISSPFLPAVGAVLHRHESIAAGTGASADSPVLVDGIAENKEAVGQEEQSQRDVAVSNKAWPVPAIDSKFSSDTDTATVKSAAARAESYAGHSVAEEASDTTSAPGQRTATERGIHCTGGKKQIHHGVAKGGLFALLNGIEENSAGQAKAVITAAAHTTNKAPARQNQENSDKTAVIVEQTALQRREQERRITLTSKHHLWSRRRHVHSVVEDIAGGHRPSHSGSEEEEKAEQQQNHEQLGGKDGNGAAATAGDGRAAGRTGGESRAAAGEDHRHIPSASNAGCGGRSRRREVVRPFLKPLHRRKSHYLQHDTGDKPCRVDGVRDTTHRDTQKDATSRQSQEKEATSLSFETDGVSPCGNNEEAGTLYRSLENVSAVLMLGDNEARSFIETQRSVANVIVSASTGVSVDRVSVYSAAVPINTTVAGDRLQFTSAGFSGSEVEEAGGQAQPVKTHYEGGRLLEAADIKKDDVLLTHSVPSAVTVDACTAGTFAQKRVPAAGIPLTQTIMGCMVEGEAVCEDEENNLAADCAPQRASETRKRTKLRSLARRLLRQ